MKFEKLKFENWNLKNWNLKIEIWNLKFENWKNLEIKNWWNLKFENWKLGYQILDDYWLVIDNKLYLKIIV